MHQVWLASHLPKVLIMRFLKNLLQGADYHIHKWEKTYSYTSLRDAFADPIGVIDRSGTITKGEECKACGKTRSTITIYAKDGGIEKVVVREYNEE